MAPFWPTVQSRASLLRAGDLPPRGRCGDDRLAEPVSGPGQRPADSQPRHGARVGSRSQPHYPPILALSLARRWAAFAGGKACSWNLQLELRSAGGVQTSPCAATGERRARRRAISSTSGPQSLVGAFELELDGRAFGVTGLGHDHLGKAGLGVLVVAIGAVKEQDGVCVLLQSSGVP